MTKIYEVKARQKNVQTRQIQRDKESRLVVARGGGRGEWRVTVNEYRAIFFFLLEGGHDENAWN